MPKSPTCTVCGVNRLWDEPAQTRGVCDLCRRNFGLSDEPPGEPLRPNRPCRCGHDKFVRAQMRERSHSSAVAYLAPLALSFRRLVSKALFSDKTREENQADVSSPIGTLEAYACLGCGLVEWYARDVRDVPIGVEYGTELVDVSTSGPFR